MQVYGHTSIITNQMTLIFFGGNKKDTAALLPVLYLFYRMLRTTGPVDCHLEIRLDYTTVKIGCKNGQPYIEFVSDN